MTQSEILEEIERLKKELEKSSHKKSLSFSQIKNSDLKELGAFRKLGENEFLDWFNYKVEIESEITQFLNSLLTREREFLKYYNEEDLKINFIAPILNRVDFKMIDLEIRAFYEEALFFESEKIILKGTPDFFISKGLFQSEAPLFFIQEFKRGVENSFPEPQLIAEMIAGVEISDLLEIKGAYIVGSIWNFVILKKVDEKYHYFVSRNFDSSREDDLLSIYKNLIFIKEEIKKFGEQNGK